MCYLSLLIIVNTFIIFNNVKSESICINEKYFLHAPIYIEGNHNFTDPNSKPVDTDNDGEPDGDLNNSQSWMDIDDDNDGITDDWEKLNKLNSTDPEDADLDPDEDGATNKEEFDANTDPFYPDDLPDNGNQMDVDKVKEPDETDYTFFLILGIVVIASLISLTIVKYFKLRRKNV
jgi:hypothetical protein